MTLLSLTRIAPTFAPLHVARFEIKACAAKNSSHASRLNVTLYILHLLIYHYDYFHIA